MHEKLSNTMTKLEAALDTVTKDLRYKFAAPTYLVCSDATCGNESW